jgi:ADP-dependent glucokinase
VCPLTVTHYILTVVGGDIQKDDIHLILEYKANEEWGIYRSPRANRYCSDFWYLVTENCNLIKLIILYYWFIAYSGVFFYRFIVHNDDNNPLVSSLEEFDKLLKEFNPNLLVVSGLQMMDNYPYPKGKTLYNYRKALVTKVAWSPVAIGKFQLVDTFLLDVWKLVLGDVDAVSLSEVCLLLPRVVASELFSFTSSD